MIDEILIHDLKEEEWTVSAENEPTQDCAQCDAPFSAVEFEGITCPDCVALLEEDDARWAEALTDETEDEQC